MKVAGCFALVSLLGWLSPAQEPSTPAKLKVTLVVILASEEGNHIDKRLTAIANEVQVKYPRLTSFRLKSMECKSLAKDESADFKTVDDKTVHCVLKQCAGKETKACLAVTAPEQGEIVYESACGKFLPIVTPYQTKSKERLILAIRVMPCKDD